MEKAGFIGVLAASFFTVCLTYWYGITGYRHDWVFGFLAVFWSLIMLLRLMTLTEPLPMAEAPSYLAQKILRAMHEKKLARRDALLRLSLGGSFALFVFAVAVFALWQVSCTLFPTAASLPDTAGKVLNAIGGTAMLHNAAAGFFDWGHGFLLLLTLCTMGFVLRSYGDAKVLLRPALLVVVSYALAGLIACLGLSAKGDFLVGDALLRGEGAGALSSLLSTLPASRALTLFDLLLLENGVIGLALLAVLLFIPLGTLALAPRPGRQDKIVMAAGLGAGLVLLSAVFLPFTPALAGCIVLACAGLFLAWGACETDGALQPS